MIRMAQYGTKHGHASGKLKSMLDHPQVEVVGLYEPDAEQHGWGQCESAAEPAESGPRRA